MINRRMQDALARERKTIMQVVKESGLTYGTVRRARDGRCIRTESAKIIARILNSQVDDMFDPEQMNDIGNLPGVKLNRRRTPEVEARVCQDCNTTISTNGACYC